jgi:iron complex outermembrane receptor protein
MQDIELTDRVRSTALALAVGLAIASAQAAAQDSPSARAASGDLEEVVVTAQRRAETLQEVPISVAVLSGETLEAAGVATVNELPLLVPGMRIDTQGAAAQPTIRGVGTSTAGTGMTSNVAVYVDGFYVPNQYDTDLQLLNLASVQVLKGPQGTLFGRNATGGAILLDTRDPSFDPTFQVQATAGSYDQYGVSLYGSTGLTETIAVDFAGAFEQGQGFLDNIATGSDEDGKYDRQSYRASVLYRNDAGLKLELAYAHSETDDPSYSAMGAYAGHSIGAIYGPLLGPALGIDPPYVGVEHGEVANTAPTGYTSESDGLFLTVAKEFGDMTLKSLTMARDSESHTDIDLDASSLPIFAVEFSPQSDAWSQEFDLSGSTDRLKWLVGAFYMEYEEEFHNLAASTSVNPDFFLQPITLVVYEMNRTKIESAAVFADATYEVVDSLFLTAGLRYSTEQASSIVRGHIAVGDMPEWSEDWDDVSPRVVARYEFDDDSSVYASYSKGFKAGMLQPSAPSTVPIDPEHVDAYEVGYKTDRGATQFNAAAFYYDYQDMQVASFNGTQALVVNAANSTIYGAEFQVASRLTEGLTASLGLAYTKSEYDEFPGSQPRVLDPLAANYLQIVDGNASGNQMMRTPELSGTATLDYGTPLAGGQLNLDASLFYTDGFYFDPNEQFEQDAYALVNIRATWVAPDGRFSVAAFANNVTNEEYLAQVLPGDYAIQQGYAKPRWYGVTIGYKY